MARTLALTLFVIFIGLGIGIKSYVSKKSRKQNEEMAITVRENLLLKDCFRNSVFFWRCESDKKQELIEWASNPKLHPVETVRTRFQFDTYTESDSICYEVVYGIAVHCSGIEFN